MYPVNSGESKMIDRLQSPIIIADVAV